MTEAPYIWSIELEAAESRPAASLWEGCPAPCGARLLVQALELPAVWVRAGRRKIPGASKGGGQTAEGWYVREGELLLPAPASAHKTELFLWLAWQENASGNATSASSLASSPLAPDEWVDVRGLAEVPFVLDGDGDPSDMAYFYASQDGTRGLYSSLSVAAQQSHAILLPCAGVDYVFARAYNTGGGPMEWRFPSLARPTAAQRVTLVGWPP